MSDTHIIQLNIAPADPLVIARMSLFQPPMICTGMFGSVSVSPWQYYSRLYNERYGYYPEMWGFDTLTCKEDEETKI